MATTPLDLTRLERTRSSLHARPGHMDLDLDLTERSIHHAGRLLVEGVRMWGLDELAPDLGLVVTVLGDRGLHIVRELAASVAITPSPGGGKDIVVIISTAPGILAADAVAA